MGPSRLLKVNNAYVSWSHLLTCVRVGAESLDVGELSMGDAHDLVVSAKCIKNRLKSQAARDAAGDK